jgi:hypothetical protein
MRVLLLTHARSGGFSITNWLSHELGVDMYHEPFNDFVTKETLDLNVFTNPNCVVKIFPYISKIFDLNLSHFVNSFDKIIVHKRGNLIETAISMAYMTEKYQDDINVNWHQIYNVDENWIKDNQLLINEQLEIVKKFERQVKSVLSKDHITTTYDGIFNTREDIFKITDFLEINYEPKWLDFLDNKRKLRNGEIGMDSIKIKKEII